MPLLRTRSIVALAGVSIAACTYPATEVIVRLDTDIPRSHPMFIVATARAGTSSSDAGGVQAWHTGDAGGIALPATFAVVPGSDVPHYGAVVLTIDATIPPVAPGELPRSLRRIARFQFTPSQTTTLPIFLAASCANLTTGCATTDAAHCTVSTRCEELGRTCGDTGDCVSPDVTPQADGGVDGGMDAAVNCTGADCECTPGATRACYPGPAETMGVGSCASGSQRCNVGPAGAGGLWGACEGAVLPAAETCNGRDDDCNGMTDDGLGYTSCGVGACVNTVARCDHGAMPVCMPRAPSTERCNGEDDDCNGRTDEGLGSTTCGTGQCRRTTANCVDGAPQSCTPGAPTRETCNDLDDDCDGQIDNGFQCRRGTSRTCSSCGYNGTQQCINCSYEATCHYTVGTILFLGANDSRFGHQCGYQCGPVGTPDDDWCGNGPAVCYAQYGPYLPLPPGRYRVDFSFVSDYTDGREDIDVWDATAGVQLAYRSIPNRSIGEPPYSLNFTVGGGCDHLEFRVQTWNNNPMRIYDTTIVRLGD